MERLTNGDIVELRQQYLFDFANLCHIGPNELDVLRLYDFWQLLLDIDAYRKEVQRVNDQIGSS